MYGYVCEHFPIPSLWKAYRLKTMYGLFKFEKHVYNQYTLFLPIQLLVKYVKYVVIVSKALHAGETKTSKNILYHKIIDQTSAATRGLKTSFHCKILNLQSFML